MVHCEKCGFPINAAGCMCGKVVPKRPQPNVTRAQKDAAEQSVQRIGLWARIKKWLGAIQSAAQQSVQADGDIALRPCEHGYSNFEYCPHKGCIRHRR